MNADPDALYREWQSLRGRHTPADRRRFLELTVHLAGEHPALFADIALPTIAVCNDCPAIRALASPTGMMSSHDHHGTYCSGSIKRPARLLHGDELVQALLDREANDRGQYCDTPEHPHHDTRRCPCRGRSR